MESNLDVRRVKDMGGRDATLLTNGLIRVMINDKGGMVPELSARRCNGWLNAHWQPRFRTNSGVPYDEKTHGSFWPVELLYELAGNFPCLPNFGPPQDAYGVTHQAHGLTANGRWSVESSGTFENRVSYVAASLSADGDYPSLPISYAKTDMVLTGHPVHYTSLRARNTSDTPYSLNAAWHNTVAPPFLAAGCLIDACAGRFSTATAGGEFDTTTRLALGAEFEDLRSAPGKDGGTVDIRIVPGMIGYTDFVTGAVPKDADLGWSAVTNPVLNTVYLTFFKGPASATPHDITLNYNDYWMQYGGRDFPPWAYYEGGTDFTFCLGTENATGAYANGLAYSLDHREVLGRPTLIELAPGEEKTLLYGTALLQYDDGVLDEGVQSVHASAAGLSLTGYSGKSVDFAACADFEDISEIADGLP